jgi:hypothetical protein
MSPASRAVAISRCGTRRRGVLEGDESEGMRHRLQCFLLRCPVSGQHGLPTLSAQVHET